MKFITFLAEFHNVTPKYKDAILIGMKWGMYLGGITVFIILAILKAFHIL